MVIKGYIYIIYSQSLFNEWKVRCTTFREKMLNCETLKCNDVSKSFLNLYLYFVSIHQLGSRMNFCCICFYTFCIFREIFVFFIISNFFAKFSHFFAKQIEVKKAKIFAFFASEQNAKMKRNVREKKEKSMCSSESQRVTLKLRLIKYAINFN